MPRDPASLPTTEAPRRLDAIDLARGVMLVFMAGYHGAWDLVFLGLADLPLLTHWFWLTARTLIAGSFLALVGVSLVLATRSGIHWGRFGRRLAVIVLCAAIVSAATFFAIPDSWIFFGILHSIAVCSVLALPFLRLPLPVLIVAAAVVIALPAVAAAPVFDTPGLRWIGLVTVGPDTFDFVPVLPWFAWVLAGIAVGRLLARPNGPAVPLWLWRARSGPARLLGFAGRHSLAVYMLHQPVLIALLAGVVLVTGQGTLPGLAAVDPRPAFVQNCLSACTPNRAETWCTDYCACLADATAAADLLDASIEDTDAMTAFQELGLACAAAPDGTANGAPDTNPDAENSP